MGSPTRSFSKRSARVATRPIASYRTRGMPQDNRARWILEGLGEHGEQRECRAPKSLIQAATIGRLDISEPEQIVIVDKVRHVSRAECASVPGWIAVSNKNKKQKQKERKHAACREAAEIPTSRTTPCFGAVMNGNIQARSDLDRAPPIAQLETIPTAPNEREHARLALYCCRYCFAVSTYLEDLWVVGIFLFERERCRGDSSVGRSLVGAKEDGHCKSAHAQASSIQQRTISTRLVFVFERPPPPSIGMDSYKYTMLPRSWM